MLNIHVSNIGFGDASPSSLEKLKSLGTITLNVEGMRYSESDMEKRLFNTNILIAGTEPIRRAAMERAPNLQLIARVGVGTDNIDLQYAHERGIAICYTPDAPSLSVPELTLGLILNLIKGIRESDRSMREGVWHRPLGNMMSSRVFGIVGAGRIGKRVIQLLHAVSPESHIFYYDPYVKDVPYATPTSLSNLFKKSDVISIHLHSNKETKNLIGNNLLCLMKPTSYLINTSRGSLINEVALYEALKNQAIAGAALDVFHKEPYQGPLKELDNCLLTAHIGSMTQEVRALMEEQVVEDIIRFANGLPLLRQT